MKVILFVLCWLALPGRAAAQCMTLADLLALSTMSGDSSRTPLSAALPGWHAKGPVAPGDKELYWELPAPNSNGVDDSLYTAWLSLRPTRNVYDVVYKSDQSSCLESLRRELARARYPVTLLTVLGGGEGVRFDAPAFSVSLYIRPKGPFSYVAFVRQNAPGEAPKRTAPPDRRTLSPSGVPRLQPRY